MTSKRAQLRKLQEICNWWIDECTPNLKLLKDDRVRIGWLLREATEYPTIGAALDYVKTCILQDHERLMTLITELEQELEATNDGQNI